jgi:hypothetical protein
LTGNAPVQAIQFVVFALVFVGGAVDGTIRIFRGRHCDLKDPADDI